ncbi:MAG: hypothetical protein ABIF40_04040 [archaeon]
MSDTWFVELEERIDRERFDSICSEIGIVYSPNTAGGNTYYDQRIIGNKKLGIGCVELKFGGIKQKEDRNLFATQLTISTNASERRYEAMKKTALDLGSKLPFKEISGRWFDNLTELDNEIGNHKPIPYNADVFEMIEKK